MSWILYGFVVSQLGDITSTFVQVLCPAHHMAVPSLRRSFASQLSRMCFLKAIPGSFWSHQERLSGQCSAVQAMHLLSSEPRLCRVQDDGTVIQVNEYLRQHFGYKHNHLGVAVGVLFAYIAIFGCARVLVIAC